MTVPHPPVQRVPLKRFAHLKRHLPVPLTVLVTALLALTVGSPQPAGAAGRLPGGFERRVGVWLTNSPSPLYYDAKRIETAVAQLDAAGFNTLYPNVWSRGATFHRSRWAPMEPALARSNPGLDPICRFTKAAHRRGMQVIPWFEYGLMEPADAEVVQRHPEWVLRRSDGSALYAMHGANLKTSPLKDLRVWLNPAHPGVRARFIGLISEIVQRCGVDGIQLDDHFAWPVELGYDPYTRALYLADTGREPPASFTDRYWMKWRRQQLTALLRELRGTIQTVGGPRRTVISLSPGPFRFAYNHWLQDWELWALGELVDDLIVQNYAYSVKGFERDLDQPALVKARRWGMPVEIGILSGFGGRTPDMATLEQKVRLSAARGHGVIFFYWEGLWGQHAGAEGAAFRQAAFRRLNNEVFGSR
ncbi:glycoside hydrolase family 10 protein [Synechococcus sp. BA-132 BA5]|uniref:glycoside hydrolase family 10 protein n=1 Tax=Synechococcus sp. BA-132 BA5 TaxID=3110252 RepID=UPI002B1F1BC0|nr:family 10 glycosylhydrolase [Synechococcus sp. BA-132 BA5]MEA5416733.1 family 10 glycosylhydrolase [Synechococcus sp. BA-132 BA5]